MKLKIPKGCFTTKRFSRTLYILLADIFFLCCFNLSTKVQASSITPHFTLNPFESSIELNSESVELISRKEVYLTFDDGPNYAITPKILDVLKEHNVKATFFVVGKEIPEREEVLRRIYKEGHSIGLHTYTHNFKLIYKSQDIFIEELKKTSSAINEVLGIYPSIIRFPGGSDLALNPEFLEKLHSEGFRIFDWNVNLGDGVNPKLPVGKLIRNSKRAKGNQEVRIMLCHCNSNNSNTYKALPEIIDYYRSEGFAFKAIDENTPEYYYKFKKRETVK